MAGERRDRIKVGSQSCACACASSMERRRASLRGFLRFFWFFVLFRYFLNDALSVFVK